MSLAIFSKYPIKSHGKIDFEGSYNGAIFADIQYKQQLITEIIRICKGVWFHEPNCKPMFEYNEEEIVDALKRELGRGGQAFYVFNNTFADMNRKK